MLKRFEIYEPDGLFHFSIKLFCFSMSGFLINDKRKLKTDLVECHIHVRKVSNKKESCHRCSFSKEN